MLPGRFFPSCVLALRQPKNNCDNWERWEWWTSSRIAGTADPLGNISVFSDGSPANAHLLHFRSMATVVAFYSSRVLVFLCACLSIENHFDRSAAEVWIGKIRPNCLISLAKRLFLQVQYCWIKTIESYCRLRYSISLLLTSGTYRYLQTALFFFVCVAVVRRSARVNH